jgi:predicted methyltransferase
MENAYPINETLAKAVLSPKRSLPEKKDKKVKKPARSVLFAGINSRLTYP